MGGLLTNQGALEAQVIEALKMDLDERKIGGGYNTVRLVEFFKECTDTFIKIIYWLDNKGRGGGDGGLY